MKTLLELIRKFEGCRLVTYKCPAGVDTIGWGTTGPDITPGLRWTQEQADDRLELDAAVYLYGTQRLIPNLSGDALEAIADFSYNLGLTRLKGSTLRKKLLAGDRAGAVTELMKWTRGGGRVLPGLIARRAAEAEYLKVTTDAPVKDEERGTINFLRQLRLLVKGHE